MQRLRADAARHLDDESASTSGDWEKMLHTHGVRRVVHAILYVLAFGTTWSRHLVCGGIPIEPGSKLSSHMQALAESVWSTGEFRDRSGKMVVAREETMPLADVCAFIHPSRESQAQALTRTVRHVACHRLVRVDADEGAATSMCSVCSDYWNSSLSRATRRGGFAEAEKVTAASSRVPLFRLPSAPLLSRSQNFGAEIKRAKTRMRLESEAVELKKVKLKGRDSSISIDELLCEAEKARKAKGNLSKSEAGLFAEDSLFAQTWKAQVKGAQLRHREQQRLDADPTTQGAKATGRGMRYHPVHLQFALRLYGKGRAAYREAKTVFPTMPCERYTDCNIDRLCFNIYRSTHASLLP
jgi:hypothetical protein